MLSNTAEIVDTAIKSYDFLNKMDKIILDENIALYIADILSSPIKNLGANLHKIRLQESPNNAAEIYVEQSLPNSLQLNFENNLVTQT